jgi:hypothetical protein
MSAAGHLYMQTNESQNRVIHFVRRPDGALTEEMPCSTGASGCGPFNYRANPAAIIIDGAQGVILTPDHRFLFRCQFL